MGKYDDLLGAAPPVTPSTAPDGAMGLQKPRKYDDLAESPRANLAIQFAADASPDAEAEAVQLARRYKLPVAVASEFREDYRKKAKTEDAQAIVDGSPKLKAWIGADESNARISHDDVENMGLLETAVNSLKRGWRGLKQILPGMSFRGNAGFIGNFDAIEAKIAKGEPIFDTEDPMALRFMTPEQRQTLRGQLMAGAATAATKVAGLEAEKSAIPAPGVVGRVSEAKTFGGAVSEFLTDPVKYIASIGPESMVQNAPGLVAGGGAGFMGKAALGAAAMGANSFIVDYNASLLEALSKAGVDIKDAKALSAAAGDSKLMQRVAAQAFAHASVVATLDTASGGMAAKALVPGTSLARRMGNLAAQTPVQGVMGGAGELGGQVAAGQEISPGNILAEIVGEAFTAPAEVASMTAGSVRAQITQARQAQQSADAVAQLSKLSEASKVRGRDGETFKAFVEQLAEDGDTPAELFIDGQTLANSLNQSGITMVELEAIAPTVAAQLEEAVSAGSDVRIPVAEFAMASEAITAPLIDDFRTSPDAMTRREGDEFLATFGDTIRSQFETELTKRDDADAYRASIETVRAEFETELNTAKRFTPDVNKAYSSLLANFYGATAARLGTTPDALLQKYKLRVRADVTGAANTLNQDGDSLAKVRADWDAAGIKHDIAEKGGVITLNSIEVPFNARRNGKGSAAMQALVEYADATGQSITLRASGQLGGDKVRLVPFYERFGFKVRAGTAKAQNLRKDTVMVRPAAGTLNQSAKDQTQTEAFKKWFKGSKVVDADGKPLVVYHGTSADFDVFDRDKAGNGPSKFGFWFADDKDFTGMFGDTLMAVYLSANNPKKISKKKWDEIRGKHARDGEWFAAWAKQLEAEGFDSLHVVGGKETLGRHEVRNPDIFAVLRPEQIKSATGNRGTFDPNDPSILNQGEATPRAQVAFADDITSSPSVISLLAGADLSSFIHESGHFFLEVQSDLAARIQQQIASGAEVSPQERGIVDDMGRLLEWFGVKGQSELSALDTWALMSLDEKRQFHEQFARGFEAYTMEGKAPSIELQAVFQRFRSWLVQVYKTLRGLNVELNDDVRAVMGRMLATDFAIEEAEAQRNMGPLFKDAQTAGMTLDEYATYQAQADAATAKAVEELQTRSMKDMKWLSRAKDKALKARQQEVDTLRLDIRNEVRREVMTEPVYQAWQFLTGKSEDAAVAGKLRTDELREMYGTAEDAVWRKLSARRMTSDTVGISPETAADRLGFDSGDALVKILADAMPPQEVIEARTDQRMLEKFGDIISQEALESAADEAVHNEARARFIAAEMKALETASKVTQRQGKSSVNVLARAAKDYAQQIVARLKVREIRPRQYAAAEARNAKLAQKSFAAGKLEEAAMHKRNQLVNNYATRAAYDAQEEVRKAQAYFRKFDKRSKSVDPEYLDQIEQMLERFDFRPTSLKDIDRRKSFAAWYAEQEAMAEAGTSILPQLPPELVNDANRRSYKDMTLEEIRGLHDTIKQMEHLGRLKNKLLLARDKRDFDVIATEMADSIIANGGKARPVQLESLTPVKDWFAGLAASHRKLASLFRQMDGNKDAGPMYEVIGRTMNERGTMEDVMVEKATIALNDLYAPMLKLKGGLTGARSKVFIPEIGASLTRGGRLSVALNWGNDANRQRIMDGEKLSDGSKWSERQVQAILKTLTPAELQFVNGVWEYLDSYWPEVAAKEKRLTGVEPEKVQASPFTAVASDGSTVEMRGGYYPIKYDSDRSDRASVQEAAQVAKEMLQGAFTRATTRRGHTKARQEEVKRAVRKDLNVITQHVTQVVHDLAWHEWLIDTNKLLADDRVVEAIRAHYGPTVLKTMRDGVQGIAIADVSSGTAVDAALLKLRANVTRATMGASLTTAFLQPFGLTQSMVRIGPKHVLRGVARWGGDAVRMENTVAWIRGKSDFMRLRAKTFNKELREIRGAVGGKSKTMRVVDAGLFMFMQKMQMVADVPTWVGQYEKSIAEGLDEAAAVSMADRAVLESQGGGQTKDLAELQRKHPMLTQFYSYFSVTMNLATESTAATDFKNPSAVAGWMSDMALLMVIPAILPPLILYGLKGGDDDDEGKMLKRVAEWQIGYLLGTVVGLREFSGAVGGFDYAGPPVARIVSATSKFGKQAAQGEVDEPAVMAAVNLAGTVFGIPIIQATRSYKGWKAWDEGEEGAGPQSILFGPPPKD